MRLSKSLIVAGKDFKVFKRKKTVLYAVAVVPFIIAVLIPAVVEFGGRRNGGTGFPVAELLTLLPAFSFFFIVLAAYIPTPIASYTLVGEKVEKSLEPLLATPTTDGEILLGKGIAAFIPALAAVLAGSTVFMVLMDLVTYSKLGYYYFPTWNTAITLFLIVPLVVILSIEVNVIVSSRINDVRTGQQLGALTVLPFVGTYVAGELGIISLGTTNDLLVVAGVILIAALALLFVAKATFRREEILTKWR
jgi:ABC-2 type transport system permease protein